ncbi:MAG TPA: heavy metal translocating P-type ATPase [Cellulomonas sp.]
MSAATLAPAPLRDGGRELTRPPSVWRSGARLPEVRWAGAALALFLLGWAAQVADAPGWLWWGLYVACYLAGGWEPARAGWRALRAGTLDVDLLMIVAAIAAAGIGQVLDGGLLIVIFATSGALEAVVTQRTADSVAALLNLAPERATLLTPDGEVEVDVAELQVGQVLLVRPGERIGADGSVVDGVSEVDQQAVTGESVPVVRSVGDPVLSGTVNGTGALRVRVDRPASESVVARIVALTEQASATKARTQLFIETVEQRYSMGVVVATLGVFAVPLLLGTPFEPALLRAITFMIVASPCAVVLSTMPPLLAAIANAGRHGVLVKSATVMETVGRTDLVAFDKTGTLTEGAPVVVDIAVHGGGRTTAEVLALAAAVEQGSEHPIGRAVVRAAREQDLVLPDAQDVRALPGRGVTGVVTGREVTVERGPAPAAGIGTVVVVRLGPAEPIGTLTLVDRLRPDAAGAVAALVAATGRPVHLLTGDNRPTADDVAARTGVEVVHADLMPQDKAQIVGDLQDAGRTVLLVGDGVNDAPALARATTGVAMGRHGSDLALDTADVVVVRDELATVPHLLRLSRRARRYVVANLAVAATFIAVLVTWDLVASLPLPLAVAGHEGSTVVVALNGLRLLRRSAWER